MNNDIKKGTELIRGEVNRALDLLNEHVQNHAKSHKIKEVPVQLIDIYVKIIKDSYKQGIYSEVTEKR